MLLSCTANVHSCLFLIGSSSTTILNFSYSPLYRENFTSSCLANFLPFSMPDCTESGLGVILRFDCLRKSWLVLAYFRKFPNNSECFACFVKPTVTRSECQSIRTASSFLLKANSLQFEYISCSPKKVS